MGLTWHGDFAQGQLTYIFAKCPPTSPPPTRTHISHSPLVGLLSAALSAWGLLRGSVPTQMNQTLSPPASGRQARGLGTQSPTLRVSPRLPRTGKGEAWQRCSGTEKGGEKNLVGAKAWGGGSRQGHLERSKAAIAASSGS